MSKREGSAIHQQALVVMGLFSGFTITALVVIMQSPSSFHVAVGPLSGEEYFEALITAIAIVGSVCIFGVLAAMEVAGGLAEEGSTVDKFGFICFLVGLVGFVGVLPLLLVPYTRIGSAIIVGPELALLAIYFTSPSKSSLKHG
jgi:hypothetical protein